MEKLDLTTFGLIASLIMIAPYISRLIKIPVVVVEILLGAFVAYYGFYHESEVMKTLSEVSFLFLMLLVGMEVDLRGFVILGKVFYKKALTYFAALYICATIVVLVFKLPYLYIAVFPVMSLGMFMILLREYGKDKEWLSIALKVGVVGELVSIVALVLINNVYSYDITSWKFYKTILILIGFVILFVSIFRIGKIIFWWQPNFKLWFMPKSDENNQDIRFSFMLFFVLMGIVAFLHLELVLGAFLAGMVIATFFTYKHDMIHKLNDVGFGFFVPLFFVHVGTTLDLKVILQDMNIILHGVYILIGMLSLRIFAATLAFGKFFKKAKTTLLFALSDCMPLTFLVATASLGRSLGAIDDLHYYSLIIAAMLEGILFLIAIKLIYLYWKVK